MDENLQALVPIEIAKPTSSISTPAGFEFGAVPPELSLGKLPVLPPAPPPPPLGPLAAFVGEWVGTGFNTIFRPDSTASPTPMPGPITTTDAADNVLELNITTESLTFSQTLGTVPNRGFGSQKDISLNGVPYLQAINDVTALDPNDPNSKPIGIHVEPGLWMAVPSSTAPLEPPTIVRMGSIPHGTTIQAQGTSSVNNGPPVIPSVDITPFFRGQPANKVPFQNQNASNNGTRRIPQNLTVAPFNKLTLAQWQARITDPNSVLRDAIAGQNIKATTTITVTTASKSTAPATTPAFGGGADNIAYLAGDAAGNNANANAIQLSATFWIEEVEHTIILPIVPPDKLHLPVVLRPINAVSAVTPAATIDPETPVATEAPVNAAHLLTPLHPVTPVHPITAAAPVTPVSAVLTGITFTVPPPPKPTTQTRIIRITTTQIQYSQTVLLNFGPLSWPHVSVATLTPKQALTLPASIWE